MPGVVSLSSHSPILRTTRSWGNFSEILSIYMRLNAFFFIRYVVSTSRFMEWSVKELCQQNYCGNWKWMEYFCNSGTHGNTLSYIVLLTQNNHIFYSTPEIIGDVLTALEKNLSNEFKSLIQTLREACTTRQPPGRDWHFNKRFVLPAGICFQEFLNSYKYLWIWEFLNYISLIRNI